jgi:ABC-type Fe3+/spermidine/putrescine transport system ATPase subunit
LDEKPRTINSENKILKNNSVLSITDIHKSFEDNQVLRGIAFELYESEIIALLGPSGCGKSTLLAIIAGIEHQDHGSLYWKGTKIDNVSPHHRGFGLMFQDYVLFPHLNVFQNVAFGLKISGMKTSEVHTRVEETLNLVGLEGFGDRDVSSLSGGEQQRTALARSIAPKPQLLMLDEPLGSIDRTMRERLLIELRKILRQLSQTAIYVTHDQEEAFAIADRVVLMREGQIEQIGPPEEIYRQPASLFVAQFLGLNNLIPGKAVMNGGEKTIETAIGFFPLTTPIEGHVTLLLRPDSAILDGSGEIELVGKLIDNTFRGNLCQTIISIKDIPLEFNFLSNADLPEIGENIQLSLSAGEAVQVFEAARDTSS